MVIELNLLTISANVYINPVDAVHFQHRLVAGICLWRSSTMARLSVLRVMLIALVVSCALLYHGSCATNEAKETKAPPTDPPGNSLRVNLIRRDSPISPLLDSLNLSNAEQLRRAVQRSHSRLRRFQHYTSQNTKSYYVPISAGDGGFLMQMAIGYPVPLNLHFILDTGSDLIWTQCQPCSTCVAQNDPMYNPSQSSSYTNVSCSNKFCLAFNTSLLDACDFQANCIYFYEYASLSYTAGVLAYETFSLATDSSPTRTSSARLFFGCGHLQSGNFINSAGIVGLGRGPLSLVSQIGSSIDHMFSYCLGSIYNASEISPLFLGRVATFGASFEVTPLIPNHVRKYPFKTFYYLGVSGISVAGKTVPIPKGTFEIQHDGTGGLIIDSGTTITYLEDPGYKPFLNVVQSSIPTRPVNARASTDFDLCYNNTRALQLPTISFHFAGGGKFVLPPENSFLSNQEYTGGLVCLAFLSAGPAGAMSIFGNVQQQNFHIAYDLAHDKLYFAPANCASL